ncbi:MAG: DNA-binding protein [Mesorhizobium sp.]|uniref:helix-turn-helix transcriptional regulator n=1 Tax=Mesorhizobium sp. TaxID=1871066 RepID=UPI000FE9C9BD|nr:helix-turn-helix domain-containing protein [Mesorhizobium sp.]RWC92307.1 MAG: DNA-binding protein [Mesorhizobium sp.]
MEETLSKHDLSRFLTQSDVCKYVQISSATYYKLRAMGLGPKETRIGSVVRISPEAMREWLVARNNPSGEEAAAQAEADARLMARSRNALAAAGR